MTPPIATPEVRRIRRTDPLLGIHFLASMVSMFVMILAPEVRFVGMAALSLQLLLPWVLVAYTAFLPHRFTFGAARRVTMPPSSLFLLVVFSAVYNLAVGVAFTYVELVSQGRLLALASVLALPLLATMLVVDRRGPRSWNWAVVAFLALASFSYSYWALRWINIVFDHSPPAAMSSVVIRKFKGVFVRVQRWGPVQDAKAIQVPHAIYRTLRPNGPVCPVMRSGALGISWYTAQTCPWAGERVTLGGADLWWMHGVDTRSTKGEK